MSGLNQHAGGQSVQAQQELNLMFSLRERPKTPAELCNELGLPTNRVRYLLRGLYEAECIQKIPGSHSVTLKATF